ncbi:SAF domain-containing protein [Actinoplanes lutulentus]|uniref:SAF domain-containing protein n=1 Tax=Actinoplanes lutulentus TaxID=1287878 RepID=UPI001FE40F39|nr:SAF domain-containing protein [Actinoplanes lutulentus]
MPFVALGSLLVIVCVLAYAWGAVRLGDRIQVLSVARPVAAGQSITAADLIQVSAAEDPGVLLIPVAQVDEVIGRTAVVPLVAGTLLTPALIGEAAFPPVGKVTASLALKPGQYPQGLPNGAQVAAFVSTGGTGTDVSNTAADRATAAPTRIQAVVLGVDLAGDGQGSTVITLLLNASDGPRLAAAPEGAVVLMQTAPGGR